MNVEFSPEDLAFQHEARSFIADNYPKIAGQHSDYLFVALKAYKTDNNAKVGRAHPIMGGMARQYTNAELKSMSKYLASLPGELKAIPESRFR